VLRETDCTIDSVWFAVPQPIEWQHIGKQFDAAKVFMRELTTSAKLVEARAAVSTLDSSGQTTFVAAAPSRRTLETINSS
jgi:hypothetical protein